MNFKFSLFSATLLMVTTAAAQDGFPQLEQTRIAVPDNSDAIALYAESVIPRGTSGEIWTRMRGQFAGRTVDDRMVRNVSWPTVTPVLPEPGQATGAAVIVAPGGAYMSLAIDHEGYRIARRLAEQGIAAFVLKYRLNPTPESDEEMAKLTAQLFASAGSGDARLDIPEPPSDQDTLQALRLVRENADQWGIDTKRVGTIGFSAGAMTTLRAVLHGKPGERPDFFGYIYGPMLPVEVPDNAPPMFAAIALDDGFFGRQGFGIIESWKNAGRPVELHAYERGDHGFGEGIPGTTTTLMIDEFVAWLGMHGMLGATRD